MKILNSVLFRTHIYVPSFTVTGKNQMRFSKQQTEVYFCLPLLCPLLTAHTHFVIMCIYKNEYHSVLFSLPRIAKPNVRMKRKSITLTTHTHTRRDFLCMKWRMPSTIIVQHAHSIERYVLRRNHE